MLGYKEKYKGGQKNRERRGSRSTQREEGRKKNNTFFGYTDHFMNKHRGSY